MTGPWPSDLVTKDDAQKMHKDLQQRPDIEQLKAQYRAKPTTKKSAASKLHSTKTLVFYLGRKTQDEEDGVRTQFHEGGLNCNCTGCGARRRFTTIDGVIDFNIAHHGCDSGIEGRYSFVWTDNIGSVTSDRPPIGTDPETGEIDPQATGSDLAPISWEALLK